MSAHAQDLRLVEAILFAAAEPQTDADLRSRLPDGADLDAILAGLAEKYAGGGVELVRVAGRWAFRTAPDLAPMLRVERRVVRKLSRAGLETLAVIAYHQPVTRAEIEEIRGVSLARGTLDALLETGWIKPGKRRETLGRPVTWTTTQGFLEHFSLDGLADLPGLDELRAAGLLDPRPAARIAEIVRYGQAEPEPPGTTDEALTPLRDSGHGGA